MARTTVTIHENDVFTVDEKNQKIGVSDQFKALFGEDGAKTAQDQMIGFLKDLQGKWFVDINFSKELPS